LLQCDKESPRGRPCNIGRPAAAASRPKALLKPAMLRSNLNSISYLFVATFKSAVEIPRFQDNIIRIRPCSSPA